MKTKLTLLLLVSIFIFGCAESNPYLGKWHLTVDGENALFELLESGNLLIHGPNGVETGQWYATEKGIAMITNDGNSGKAFVNGDSLSVTADDETFTLKRVK